MLKGPRSTNKILQVRENNMVLDSGFRVNFTFARLRNNNLTLADTIMWDAILILFR
jgi:hypothetical protein